MTERQLQDAIVAAARLHGWLVYHTFDSRRSEPGFPDLVLVRDRVLFAELKTERGKVSAEQEKWMLALEHAGADVRVWRPADWLGDRVVGELA